MCAPTARNAASNRPAFIVSWMWSTFVFSFSSTPRSRMRCTSASSTSRGRRYFGMPKRIMPPANGPASRIFTAWPRRAQVIGRGKPGGARAHDEDALAGPASASVELPAAPDRLVAEEALDRIDADRLSSCARLHELSQGW